MWDQRIPLLQHYLETHTVMGAGSPTWNQGQWEDWILALLDDTVKEIDLDEWCSALAGAMCQQLQQLYHSLQDTLREKCFVMRAMGRVMRVSKSGTRQLVTDNLGAVFTLTQHDGVSNVQVSALFFLWK